MATIRVQTLESTEGEDTQDLPRLITDWAINRAQVTYLEAVTNSLASMMGEVPADLFSTVIEARELGDTSMRDAASKNTLRFLAMAGLCVLGKPITRSPDNTEYLRKRWKALCAGAGISDTNPGTREIMDTIEIYQTWIHEQPLIKRKWVQTALDCDRPCFRDVKSQALLVWEFSGMKSYQLMRELTSTPVAALTLEAVHRQALNFRTAWEAIAARLGDTMPYAYVLGEDLTSIQHRLYPDLYHCAITKAIKDGRLGSQGAYIKSQVQTQLQPSLLDKHLVEFKATSVIDPEVGVRRLAELGLLVTEDDIKRVTKRKRRRNRDSSSEEEDE